MEKRAIYSRVDIVHFLRRSQMGFQMPNRTILDRSLYARNGKYSECIGNVQSSAFRLRLWEDRKSMFSIPLRIFLVYTSCDRRANKQTLRTHYTSVIYIYIYNIFVELKPRRIALKKKKINTVYLPRNNVFSLLQPSFRLPVWFVFMIFKALNLAKW